MGYARLTYPNNNTIRTTSILHDIVGCVTGRFSSSVQIITATSAELVNTLGENWNFLYPSSSSFVNNAPDINIASWVLTSPCIDNSKIKYVRLFNYYKNSTFSVNITGAVARNLYTIGASNDGNGGILLQAGTSASNATTLTNPTFFNTNNTLGDTGALVLNGTTILVSWSARHLIVWSDKSGCTPGGNSPALFGYLEYPETDVTVAKNRVPAGFLIERNGTLDVAPTLYGPYDAGNTATYGDIQFPEFYNCSTTSTASVSLAGLTGTFDNLTTTIGASKPISTIPTIDQNNINTRMMVPIVVNALSVGVPNIHLSKYTNVYIVADNLGSPGTILSGSVGQYMYIPTDGFSFAVKRE